MIEVKHGDLFEDDVDVVCHQVNCRGTMGKGVAKQFAEKFPRSARAYWLYVNTIRQLFGVENAAENLLGQVVWEKEKGVWTCSMFAQDAYGYGKCFTDYAAFRKCCKHLRAHLEQEWNSKDRVKVGMPYKIGCGLAGGDWSIVHAIIEEELGDWHIVLYKRGKSE